jgi:protein transport protein SEC61 subunit gamma and related proteins
MEIMESFIQRSMRVLRVSYRPKSEEFWLIAKITGLGMILIGLIGFIITIILTYVNSAV